MLTVPFSQFDRISFRLTDFNAIEKNDTIGTNYQLLFNEAKYLCLTKRTHALAVTNLKEGKNRGLLPYRFFLSIQIYSLREELTER